MYLRLLLIISVLIFFPVTGTIFAASDPITDFCSSAQAQADEQARQECVELQSLQGSNLKIKDEKDSIQKEISLIDAEIKIAQQKIKVQERIISQLSKDIGVKSNTVQTLEQTITKQSKSMSQIIQKLNVSDSMSLVEILAGHRQTSDFFIEVDSYNVLNKNLLALLVQVKSNKAETEIEKQNLETRKDKETNAKQAIETEKRLIDRKKVEKGDLLKLKTSEYNIAQKILSSQQQKVAQIRSRLLKFQDGEGIPFGDAYDFAAKASKLTGVRPALLLGILFQESSYDTTDSSFGKNVGNCFLRDTTTGDGVSAKDITIAKQRVIKPDRISAFIKLTGELGRDWMTTRVSCWIVDYDGGLPTGWGGAMGSAQFLATTWDNGSNSSISKRTSRFLDANLADPWNPAHAITAASIFLADLGAGTQTFSDEKNAACRYYSGKKCSQSTRANGYGTSVMKHVAGLQDDIDILLGK